MKPSQEELQEYLEVQRVAKETMNFLMDFIKEGATVIGIVEAAENFMNKNGVTSFWYHEIGALIFTGKDTTISISGKEYKPGNVEVKRRDIITVDLSPSINGYWGDYARTLVVENGKVKGANADDLEDASKEVKDGLEAEERLHDIFKKTTTKESTFEEVFFSIKTLIDDWGYENLDFAGNLGHTIEKDKNDRLYFEMGNKTKLKDVGLFTFEPHIKEKGGKYGFKREDIYYLDGGVLEKV